MIYVLRYGLIVLYTAIWSSIAIVIAVFDRSGDAHIWAARQWVRWILWTCGIEVRAEGLEELTAQGPPAAAVWMSNHRSVFDTAAIIATLPVSFRFVAKRELTWIPIFGWALLAAGHVIVDRSDRQSSIASMKRAAERLAHGMNVIVFPEGRRSRTGELAEFKSGGFHLAIEAGVPVIPISVTGSTQITPKHSLRVESGRICVRYGAPMPTADLDAGDRNELKAAVRRAILVGLRDLDRPDELRESSPNPRLGFDSN